jgi:K+-transporting ATPase ATPase F chain
MTPYDGANPMSVLNGVSLLLAVALFIYLLVALLRADRN